MNRTALCIRMLGLLKSRGKMSTKEIAEVLETNPRNIREFRKELVIAGFNIIETKGRYGGYELDEDTLFPTLRLTDEEIKALDESRHFVQSHNEYKSIKEYNSAVDKIMQMTKEISRTHDTYMNTPSHSLTKEELDFYNVINEGIRTGYCVEISYQNAKETNPTTFLIDPYTIIHYENAYYINGFSHRRNDYRTFRISKERMYTCELTKQKFLRDSHYKIESYIGKDSIFKGSLVKVVLKVDKNKIRIVRERYWGSDFYEEKHSQYSLISFYTENLLAMYGQIYYFQDAIEIIEPQKCRDSYVQSIQGILKKYGK